MAVTLSNAKTTLLDMMFKQAFTYDTPAPINLGIYVPKYQAPIHYTSSVSPVTPIFSIVAGVGVKEGANATFTITLNEAQSKATSVNLLYTPFGHASTADFNLNDITIPTGFTLANGVLTFPAYTTKGIITVPIMTDLFSPETGEGFKLSLSSGTNSKVNDTMSSVAINIIDVPATTSKTINHNPTGTAIGFANGEEDTSYKITSKALLNGFSDPDGDLLSFSTLTATNGKISQNTDGSWLLVPDTNFNGIVKLDYIVSDNKGGAIDAVLNFVLNPVNDNPTGKSTISVNTGFKNSTVTLKNIDFTQGFKDLDGNSLQTANVKTTNATITEITTKTWIINPDVNFTGTVNVNFDVIDNNGGSTPANFSFIIKDNNGNDSINGTDVIDILDGGLGIDILTGGKGDDYYVVDNKSDLVIERYDEGTDTVQSLISYTLGYDLENLELLGSDKTKGTGNGLDNYITGNDANNTLNGMIGDDTLIGGLGSDTLIGGKGTDKFEFNTSDFFSENNNGDYVYNKSIDTVTDFNLLEGDTLNFDDAQLDFFSSLTNAKTAQSPLFYAKGIIYINSDSTGETYNPVPIIKLTGSPKVNADLTDWNYPNT